MRVAENLGRFNANLSVALVVGELVALAARHAKVRRRGYQTHQA
jgi:hypothetical protein